MNWKAVTLAAGGALGLALLWPKRARAAWEPARPKASDPYPSRMSDEAIAHMRKGEGVVDRLYNDPYGHCTIGIGHLVHTGNCHADSGTAEFRAGGIPPAGNNTRAPNQAISRERAEEIYLDDVQRHADPIIRYLGDVKVTQAQFDALVSAAFNAGPGRVKRFIIDPYLKKGDFEGAAQAFTVVGQMGYYPEGHPRHLAGLNRRREYERDLFLA